MFVVINKLLRTFRSIVTVFGERYRVSAKLSFGTNRMAACANIFMCLFITNYMEMFITGLILYIRTLIKLIIIGIIYSI